MSPIPFAENLFGQELIQPHRHTLADSRYGAELEEIAVSIISDLADAFPLGTGAWAEYTPTWSGTLGNGVLVGRYQRVGRVIHFYISLRWGSTTSHPASPQEWGVPVAAIASTFYAPAGVVTLEDVGTSLYTRLAVFPASATVVRANLDNAYATNTVPFTWTNGDGVVIRGTYEAAS